MSADPTVAAARQQWAVDRIVEHLVGWGCPLEHAEHRAHVVLAEVLAAGYSLPSSLTDAAAPSGRVGGSTERGRTRARLVYTHHLIPGPIDDDDAQCACRQWAGVRSDHERHVAAMFVAGGVATPEEARRARPERGAGPPEPRQGVSEVPPGPSRGAQGRTGGRA